MDNRRAAAVVFLPLAFTPGVSVGAFVILHAVASASRGFPRRLYPAQHTEGPWHQPPKDLALSLLMFYSE